MQRALLGIRIVHWVVGWAHTDVFEHRSAQLRPFDLQVAQIGIRNGHVAHIDIIECGVGKHDLPGSNRHTFTIQADLFDVFHDFKSLFDEIDPFDSAWNPRSVLCKNKRALSEQEGVLATNLMWNQDKNPIY